MSISLAKRKRLEPSQLPLWARACEHRTITLAVGPMLVSGARLHVGEFQLHQRLENWRQRQSVGVLDDAVELGGCEAVPDHTGAQCL